MKPLNFCERLKIFLNQIFCRHYWNYAYTDFDNIKHYICSQCLKTKEQKHD